MHGRTGFHTPFARGMLHALAACPLSPRPPFNPCRAPRSRPLQQHKQRRPRRPPLLLPRRVSLPGCVVHAPSKDAPRSRRPTHPPPPPWHHYVLPPSDPLRALLSARASTLRMCTFAGPPVPVGLPSGASLQPACASAAWRTSALSTPTVCDHARHDACSPGPHLPSCLCVRVCMRK